MADDEPVIPLFPATRTPEILPERALATLVVRATVSSVLLRVFSEKPKPFFSFYIPKAVTTTSLRVRLSVARVMLMTDWLPTDTSLASKPTKLYTKVTPPLTTIL
jgi:hypothetical protein